MWTAACFDTLPHPASLLCSSWCELAGRCRTWRIPTALGWCWSGCTAPSCPLPKRLVMGPSAAWVSLACGCTHHACLDLLSVSSMDG